MQKHLWEIEHPYYCVNQNYCKNDSCETFDTLDSFLEDVEDEDFDYNLIFRWDWKEESEENSEKEEDEKEEDDPIEINVKKRSREDESKPQKNKMIKMDENCIPAKLHLYYMNQRQGYFRVVIVKLTRADESKVLKFLKPRWEYVKSIWSPFMEGLCPFQPS